MTWKTAAIMIFWLGSLASAASAQICVPPPPGLVGWWPGDGTTQDLVAANDGAWSGQVAYRSAIVDQGFAFNNASIIVPNSVALSPTNAITVEAWISRDFRWSDYDPLIAKFGEPPFGPEKGFHLAFHETRVNFSVYLAGIGWLSSYDGFEVADGVWTHVAGVYDGSEIRLYVNGALALPPYPVVGTMVPSSNPLYIGSDQDTRFHGSIDEAQVFNRALSEAEIHAQYSTGSAGQCRPNSATAAIQQPIDANGGSVFNAKRGVVPVKFTLAVNGVSTCELPPATISLFRTAGGTLGVINESDFIGPSDAGSNFRVAGCQYVYNLGASSLGIGSYVVQINVGARAVGTGSFSLR